MSAEELIKEVGEMQGTLKTYMGFQKERDEKLDARLDILTKAVEKVNLKADQAHGRISRYKNIGTGITIAGTSIWAFIKFVWEHGKDIVHTAEKLHK